ncbi:hypothetical protein NUSPORA_01522 [Nucleospora cyclopteri]
MNYVNVLHILITLIKFKINSKKFKWTILWFLKLFVFPKYIVINLFILIKKTIF